MMRHIDHINLLLMQKKCTTNRRYSLYTSQKHYHQFILVESSENSVDGKLLLRSLRFAGFFAGSYR